MRVLLAQIGARRHYAVARALHDSGLLERLVTDACVNIAPWSWLDRLIPAAHRPRICERLLGRHVPDVPPSRIVGHPWFALSGFWERPQKQRQTDFWAARNAAFCRRVVRDGLGRADTVYAYNGAALEIFEAARANGLKTVLDQTAAPWRWNSQLLAQECARWPGWEEVPAEVDISGHLSEREEAEWQLADAIICGSSFAATMLGEAGGPMHRCHVVPYPALESADAGSDDRFQLGHGRHAHAAKPGAAGRPLRVLFVGTLQLRKGVQYLLAAKRLLRDTEVEMRLVGPTKLSAKAMRELAEDMDVVGPVPRASVTEHYAWADLFVLPTLSEGSANVCQEALAFGLPVVTTPNAGSSVRHGIDGIIIPPKEPVALASAITEFATSLQPGIAKTLLNGCGEPEAPSSGGLSDYSARLEDVIASLQQSPAHLPDSSGHTRRHPTASFQTFSASGW